MMFRVNYPKKTEKPKSYKAQVSTLWDLVTNHVLTWMYWQDVKMNFVLTFLALILAALVCNLIMG